MLVLAAAGASAQISPGELSQPHAALDSSSRCLDCHSPRHGVDPARCLACHGALSERLDRGSGLHAGEEFRACERCHIEHQGRAFELIYWGDEGPAAFDHSRTGWALAGAHAGLGCRDCHRRELLAAAPQLATGGADPDRTFLGLEASCASCHRDPHQGQFGAASCGSCHRQSAWKPAAGFDHARTAFPLTGRHAGLACATCHPAAAAQGAETAELAVVRYRGVATACAACHADPHAGRLGASCESCHATTDWHRVERAGFDHGSTAYPLLGRHAAVECAACHRPGRPLRIPGFERCATCHADAHAGQLSATAAGDDCARCHTVGGFRPAHFTVADHQRTAYPLEGAHRQVGCGECHVAADPREIERDGVSLVFAGARPAELIRFRFGRIACRSCHDDPHGGQVDGFLGAPGCASCHRVTEWSEVIFEHALTRFELLGAHTGLACRDCHSASPGAAAEAASGPGAGRALRFGGVPRECAGCHADPHRGQFRRGSPPRGCEACHGNQVWGASGFDHRRDTAFALEGAHRAVACISCHPTVLIDGRAASRYRGVSRRCEACHSSLVPPA